MDKITNPKVDEYIEKKAEWRELLESLRTLCLSTEMEETVKWGMPTYTIKNKNVVGFAAFKHHVALWFHHGSFLKDKGKKLVNAQEGTTRGMRQWRFNSVDELEPAIVAAYLEEAIQNEKDGKRIKNERAKKVEIPSELSEELNRNSALKKSFEQLSPGKRREFAVFIGSAKQAKTRQNRLERCIPLIMDGIGLNDRYR